jgi:hypothetical protein
MEDDLILQVEGVFTDENTVLFNIYVDETDDIKPNEMKFELADGTALEVVKSDGMEQANGEPVYQVIGVKKA